MSSTQSLHTIEFIETIFCFSILVLLGQRIMRIWKKLDDKYAQNQVKLHKEEQMWNLRKQNNKPSEKREQNDLHKVQQQYQASQEYKQNQKVQPPKEENLRTSLVGVDQERTDRQIAQNNDIEVKQPKRKSLTDLMKEQQRNSREIEIQNEPSSRKHSVNSNSNSQGMKEKTSQQDKKNSIGIERLQSIDLNNEEPSIAQNHLNPQNPQGEQRQSLKTEFNLQVILQIDNIFTEHVPVLVSVLIMGVLVRSTYIFTIVCFFGYIFSHLVLVNLFSASPHRNEPSNQSISYKLGLIVPKLWIIALFISYWADTQFS